MSENELLAEMWDDFRRGERVGDDDDFRPRRAVDDDDDDDFRPRRAVDDDDDDDFRPRRAVDYDDDDYRPLSEQEQTIEMWNDFRRGEMY